MFVVEGDHETLAGELDELAHQGLPRTAVDAAGADRCGFRVHRVGVFRVDTGFKKSQAFAAPDRGKRYSPRRLERTGEARRSAPA